MDNNQRVLIVLVENNEDHTYLIRRGLSTFEHEFELVIFNNITSALNWLETHTPSLLITDLNLPDGSGTHFFTDGYQSRFPVMVITSHGDEMSAVEVMKAGAVDYLVKNAGMYRELPHAIRRALNKWDTLQENRRIVQKLQESEAKYRTIFEHSPVGIFYFDQTGVVLDCNQKLMEIIGSPREAIIGIQTLNLPDAQLRNAIQTALSGQSGSYIGNYQAMTSGKVTPVRGVFSPIFLTDGSIAGGIGIIEDFTQQKKAELLQESLYKIAQAANIVNSLTEFYSEIHAMIQKLLPAENFYIALWDKQSNTLSFPYFIDQYDQNPGVVEFGSGMTEYVLRTGKSILADSAVTKDLEQNGEVSLVGTPSIDWLGVPLQSKEHEVFGALVVQSYNEGVRYTEADKFLLEYVSSQIAIVLQRLRLEEAEHQQRLLAETLVETSSALNSSLDVDEVIRYILVNLEKITPYDLAVVILLHNSEATILASHGVTKSSVGLPEKFNWRDFKTYSLIYQSAAPLIIPDVQSSPLWKVLPEADWIRSYAGAPLISKGKVIGFLDICSRQKNRYSDIKIGLQAFANQAAKALENAKLYEEVHQLAIQDELTGLYNRRGLIILGNREVERSIRFNRHLSVIFCDVDDFKMFNDKYSYAIGDQALRALADFFRERLREVDIISRYGGDEFVILLPEADMTMAQSISNRLKNAISSLSINAYGRELGIHISSGVYSRTSEDLSLDLLLEKAGRLLQIAKKSGKNHTVFSNNI